MNDKCGCDKTLRGGILLPECNYCGHANHNGYVCTGPVPYAEFYPPDNNTFVRMGYDDAHIWIDTQATSYIACGAYGIIIGFRDNKEPFVLNMPKDRVLELFEKFLSLWPREK